MFLAKPQFLQLCVHIASGLVALMLGLSAQGSENHWTGADGHSWDRPKTFKVVNTACMAVDAKGGEHHSNGTPAGMIWLRDVVAAPKPDYFFTPDLREGVAIFRLTLDPATGLVQEVTILKPSTWATLDRDAMKALRRWRWKPGTWKEIELPVLMSAYRNR